jgi:regulator of sigma E protease
LIATETLSLADRLHGYLNSAASIGMVALGLGFVIFVHELGHFLAAKACGVKAEKFYIGFDIPMPKILGWQIPSRLARFQWGETEYGIGILPLGGYVKMLGQDDNPAKFKEEQERAKAKAAGDTAGSSQDAEGAAYDPRSYQAKNVPQRMLIISAGVIMNLIFAVLMAAFAYRQGVPYTPTIVGHTLPSTAGWARDFRPGDKIIRLGANEPVREHLRFKQDLVPKVLLASGEEIDILVRRGEKELSIKVTGTKREGDQMARIGISPARDTVIGGKEKLARVAANRTDPPLEPGDRIVAIDGQKIDNDAQLQAILAREFDKSLKLTLARPELDENKKPTGDESKVETTLPAQPLRRLGFYTGIGPVAQVRDKSPAQSSLEVGDQIISINGEPVGDPFTLSQRMVAYAGKEITVEVERKNASGKTETKIRKLTPQEPRMMDPNIAFTGELIGIEPFGVAVPVEFKLVHVEENGPAAKLLKPGDEITHVQFTTSDADDANWLKKMRLQDPITLSQTKENLVLVEHVLQDLPDSVSVEITYLREGQKPATVTIEPKAGAGYLETRGLVLKEQTEIYTAQSWTEAMSLGVRETKEKLKEVGSVLNRLVTGRIPMGAVGGPITIARAAFMEASEGWSTLLIFLTLLSANLALINFLPIPVLDGGHMVFLAYEGVTGRPPNEKVQHYALMVGLAMLLCLMVLVFGNDILGLIKAYV